MEYNERMGAIECILFVSGDPVPIIELQRAIGVTDIEMEHIIRSMDELYKREKRGVQLFITAETMQLVSNKEYTRVRGVRCEYAVGQLMKLGMIRELGRKNVVGRPMLLGTTDAFLRHFGIRSLSELPQLSEIENAEENDNTEDKASN